jgi:hypothetical protein
MNGLNFIARNGIKALVALVAIDVVGVPAEQLSLPQIQNG